MTFDFHSWVLEICAYQTFFFLSCQNSTFFVLISTQFSVSNDSNGA